MKEKKPNPSIYQTAVKVDKRNLYCVLATYFCFLLGNCHDLIFELLYLSETGSIRERMFGGGG